MFDIENNEAKRYNIFKDDVDKYYEKEIFAQSIIEFLYPKTRLENEKKIKLYQKYFFFKSISLDITQRLEKKQIHLNDISISLFGEDTILFLGVFYKELIKYGLKDSEIISIFKNINFYIFYNSFMDVEEYNLDYIKEVCFEFYEDIVDFINKLDIKELFTFISIMNKLEPMNIFGTDRLRRVLSCNVYDLKQAIKYVNKMYKRGSKCRNEKYICKFLISKNILDEKKIVLNPNHIYDMYFEEFTEYNRQILLLFSILYDYMKLKENSHLDYVATVYFLSGKAQLGYYFAKEFLKLLYASMEMINKDLSIRDKIKIVFLENYSRSMLKPYLKACDIYEDISFGKFNYSKLNRSKFESFGSRILSLKSPLIANQDNSLEKLFEFLRKDRSLKFNYNIDDFLVLILNYGDAYKIFNDFSSYKKARELIYSEIKEMRRIK